MTTKVLGAIGLVNVEMFLICHEPHGLLCVTLLCGWAPLILSHHHASFGVHKPCESGDITFLSCDHNIEVSHDFVGGVPSS